MMTAKEAAKFTLASIRERNSLQELERHILEAAKGEQHELQLPIHIVAKIFGPLTADIINLPAKHPVPLRVAWAELLRHGYKVNFVQYSDGWCLDISWKSELTF